MRLLWVAFIYVVPDFGAAHEVHSGIRLRSPNAFSTPNLNLAQSHIAIKRSTQNQPKHEALSKFLDHDGMHDMSRSKQPSVPTVNLRGTSYVTDVTVGTQSIPLLIDTGSADLWVAPSSFVCLDADDNEVPQSECGFPVLFEGDLSGGLVPDQYFSVYYGSGQFAYGPYGLEDVSLGDITVSGQQIALPSTGFIQSSTGDYSGVLGLGYPGMVAARDGMAARPALNNTDPFASYDPWLFSAIKRNLTLPVFSLALNIDGGGLLGMGGAVDVPIVGGYASTPILMIDLVGEARAESHFTFYTIIADDYLVNGQSFSNMSSSTNMTSGGRFPVIVDSGYSVNILPPTLVDLYYGALNTPPQLVDIGGSSMLAAPCDGEVPSFGIQIDSHVFTMAAQDILVASMSATINGTVFCGLGIQPGVEGAGALGDPFLNSVVAVFDIGASEMRFAQRSVDSSAGGSAGKAAKDSSSETSTESSTDQVGPSCRTMHSIQHGV